MEAAEVGALPFVLPASGGKGAEACAGERGGGLGLQVSGLV